MSFDFKGTGNNAIRLGGSGYYNDPRVTARLSHPGLAFERTRDSSNITSCSDEGGFGLRQLGNALDMLSSESTCFGVA